MGPRTVIAAALLLAAVTAGCSSDPAPATEAPQATPAPAAVEAPTAEPAPLDAGGLLAAITTPEMTAVTVFDAATDPNQLLGRPGGYTSRASWEDVRIPAEDRELGEPGDASRGGAVECYPDETGAAERLTYLAGFNGSALMSEYQSLHGTCVLRVAGALLPDQAATIAAAADAATA